MGINKNNNFNEEINENNDASIIKSEDIMNEKLKYEKKSTGIQWCKGIEKCEDEIDFDENIKKRKKFIKLFEGRFIDWLNSNFTKNCYFRYNLKGYRRIKRLFRKKENKFELKINYYQLIENKDNTYYDIYFREMKIGYLKTIYENERLFFNPIYTAKIDYTKLVEKYNFDDICCYLTTEILTIVENGLTHLYQLK